MGKTTHNWERQNNIKKWGSGRVYDEYECILCKLRGLSVRPGYIELQGNIKDPYNCRRALLPLTVKITRCNAEGKQFKNLTPGSIHDVVKPPPGKYGLWVMGVGEPVKLLPGEYMSVELSLKQKELIKKEWYKDVL